jgi:hypothetical protein
LGAVFFNWGAPRPGGINHHFVPQYMHKPRGVEIIIGSCNFLQLNRLHSWEMSVDAEKVGMD